MSRNPSHVPNDHSASDALAALLRDDAQFEPPASALAAARALGARLNARLNARLGAGAQATRTSLHASLTAEIGALFDKAGATLVGWLTHHDQADEARLAFAGLRDDITTGFCADVLDADLTESNLRVRAERTRGQDGVVRLVGEIRASDFTPARAGVLMLDAQARVLACQESDAVGLFRLVIPNDAVEIAFVPQPQRGQTLRSCVLPLRPRSDA